MKNIIALSLLTLSLCSCAHYAPVGSAMMDRQVLFLKELRNYSLPSTSIPSGFPPSTPSYKLYLAAEKIAEQQGLISDATMASTGKLVVGKKENIEDTIVGIQFLQFDGGGVGFENITKSNGLHIEECQKMEKKYMSALKKEFYANFNK